MKHEMDQEKRFRSLKTKFRNYAYSHGHSWRNVPEEAQDRINKTFERYIESILDIDYTNELSTDEILCYYIMPLVDHAIIMIKVAKYETIIKREESSSDNEISRRKMNDPEIRRKALEDLFHRQASYIYYRENVPEEAQDRINKAFEQYIESILDVMDTDGVERLLLPIDYIFSCYVSPLVYHTIIMVEVNKLEEK